MLNSKTEKYDNWKKNQEVFFPGKTITIIFYFFKYGYDTLENGQNDLSLSLMSVFG